MNDFAWYQRPTLKRWPENHKNNQVYKMNLTGDATSISLKNTIYKFMSYTNLMAQIFRLCLCDIESHWLIICRVKRCAERLKDP